ncbi:MAG: flagellar export protein FliJ [Lachnospiraceae bacterium]|nr:flagellar export protein FliJ [Lachnospiraceae bacterium]
MAKFIYRMQNILNLNEKLEEQAKMEYATQQMVLNEEEEKEQRLRDRKAAYEDEARRIREDSVNVKEMMLNANAISIMGELINEQHGVVLKEEEVLEVRRAALEEAMKDRKTQEKLKEKAFDVFKQELAMEESKEIDQLTSYTFGIRKQKNNG